MADAHPRSSRLRYRVFREDYQRGTLDDATEAGSDAASADAKARRRGSRRAYLRQYLGWLRPHSWAVTGVFLLAVAGAGLQMIEPLFMRFIVDDVLLNAGLDTAGRLSRLH